MVNIEKPDFENMSDNKKYFIIGIATFLILLIIAILFLGGGNKNGKKSAKVKGELSIWTVGESQQDFTSFINDYKTKNKLTSLNIQVKNFPNFETYYFALNSAFLKNSGPDIFVINNNDYSEKIFEEKILGLDSNTISLSNFRKNYKQIFSQELIREEEIDGKKINYLVGVPLGYETISLFYNKKLLRFAKGTTQKDVYSWAGINSILEALNNYDKDIIGIGMGVGNQIRYSSDILASLAIQNGTSSVSNLAKIIGEYINYRDYGMNFDSHKTSKNDIELFKSKKLAIILGYPRILEELSGMRDDNYVLASTFPKASSSKNNLFLNYNYYVVNIDSKNILAAQNILAYFASEKGNLEYFSKYNKYLLPAQNSVLEEIRNDKINDNFSITYEDLINPNNELQSFDKKISFIYDNGIKNVLDADTYNYQIVARNFIKRIESIYRNIVINN